MFLITTKHFPFTLVLIIFVQRPVLHTLSNAALKSINVQNSFFFFDKYKFIRECKIKILSHVECPFLNPACEGEIRLISSENKVSLLFNILVNTLPKQLTKVIDL